MQVAWRTVLIVIACGWALIGLADQTVLPNYAKTQRDVFWESLYPGGGYTFYCGEKFTVRQHTTQDNALSIEHIVPAQRMVELFGCGSRSACRASSVRFNRMEADMHNMYPALKSVNSSRQDLDYGIISGNTPNFANKTDATGAPVSYAQCDFERTSARVEPREVTKGNIARAYFYMMQEYGLAVPDETKALLQQWNRADPPTCSEMRRNNTIERIQGTRNRFIDQPHFADDL